MSDLLSIVFILLGSIFIFIAAVGVVRFPDVLCRSHAVAKALTLGIFLMLIGLWIYLDEPHAKLKISLTIFFQLITIPVASHLLGLLALEKKLPRWKERPLDKHHPSKNRTPDS